MAPILQISNLTLTGFDNNRPVEDLLKEAKDDGYDGVELTFEGHGVLNPGTPEKVCRGYRETADRLGMRLASLASCAYWGRSFGHPSEAVRAEAVAFGKAHLRAAAWLGAETVLMLPGVVWAPFLEPPVVARYDEVLERAPACLRQLLPVAERLGVAIGLENAWNWFLTDPFALRTFIDQFDSPWIGAFFDAGNALLNSSAEHGVRLLGRRIKAVHVKNFKRRDGAGGFGDFTDDLLEGDLDWPGFLDALRIVGFDGPVTVEIMPTGRISGPEIARDTAPKLRKIFGA